MIWQTCVEATHVLQCIQKEARDIMLSEIKSKYTM